MRICSHPPDLEKTIDGLLSRLHVLIIGPGLGREDYMQAFARLTLSLAKKQDMYVVLDADALWMVQKDPETIKGYPKAVLTPNLVEFKRLCEALVSRLAICERREKAYDGMIGYRSEI